ncbi:NAD-binding protein [Peptoniphilus equinus]|uniref:NAD-binding protein n=1 Tax=Peptoniphilus equinus TaxID=3016343 RepID=A0ABY7QUU7_9FIRM|nr:TrkA C-terminal domain-containing protein [Peptoniphilus equinus]WBW50131.1 NAD-binding protein [Peptoniphilus equinus]
MKRYLIVGYSAVAAKVIPELVVDGDVTVLDRSERKLNTVMISSRLHAVSGNILHEDVIREIKDGSYDYILALTDSDRTNMLLCKALKTAATTTVALVHDMDTYQALRTLHQEMGIDKMVGSLNDVAQAVCHLVSDNLNYQSETFGLGKIEVTGHRVLARDGFDGKAIQTIDELKTLLVVGVTQGGELVIPGGDHVVHAGDYLYLMGLKRDILSFKNNHFHLSSKGPEDLLIVGSDHLATRMATFFENYHVNVVDDGEGVLELRHRYDHVFAKKTLLKGGEFLKSYPKDTVLLLTPLDEQNILLGLVAKTLGYKKVIVKVSDESYYTIVDGMQFTSVVNAEDIIAKRLVQSIHAERNVSVYMAFNGQAQVMEFQLPDHSWLEGRRLKDVGVPEGILIGGIIRRDKTAVIPRGGTGFEAKDTLIVFYSVEAQQTLHDFITGKGQS